MFNPLASVGKHKSIHMKKSKNSKKKMFTLDRKIANGEELTDLFDSDPIGWQARQATIGARVQNDFSLVQSFPGTIDELAIYDSLLSDERIKAHYEAGLGIAPLTLDELQGAIKDGLTNPRFDVNSDGNVDVADQNEFVETVLNTYVGDSNLDGVFDSGDLVAVFTIGEYEDNDGANPDTIMNSTWEEGDWNADREFDSADFVSAFSSGGYDLPPRAATAAVPEPTTTLLSLLGMAIVASVRRRS